MLYNVFKPIVVLILRLVWRPAIEGAERIPDRGAVILASKGLVTASGSSMTTTLGTPVVAGRGYPGSAPDGTAAAAGQSWAYATGQLIGLRSDIFSGLGDGAAAGMPYLPNNDLYAIAERTYVVGWTGCTENRSAAVNLDLEG